jgi:proteasome assembly chaperone (PAC2) family protein
MNIEQNKIAMKFLKKIGLLKRFSIEVDKRNYNNRNFEEFLEKVEDYDLFNSAFEWSSTVEGHDYWSRIHNDWNSFRRNN